MLPGSMVTGLHLHSASRAFTAPLSALQWPLTHLFTRTLALTSHKADTKLSLLDVTYGPVLHLIYCFLLMVLGQHWLEATLL